MLHELNKLRMHLTVLNWEYHPNLSFFEFQELLTLSNIGQYQYHTSCQKYHHFLEQLGLHFIFCVINLQLHIHYLLLYHINKGNWISITIIKIYICDQSIRALSNWNHLNHVCDFYQRMIFMEHLFLANYTSKVHILNLQDLSFLEFLNLA